MHHFCPCIAARLGAVRSRDGGGAHHGNQRSLGEVLEAAGVPCGPVYNYAQLFADPQVRHRGLVQFAADAELGEVPHIRTPIKIGEGVQVRTVAPKLASTMPRSSAGSG